MNIFKYRSGKFGKLIYIFNFVIAINPWGNCFSPALCFNWYGFRKAYQSTVFEGQLCYPAALKITLRTRCASETSLYWRGWFRFDWNSGHLARWFGKKHEAEWGDYFVWRSHNDME